MRKSQGRTPIYYAAREGNKVVTELLLSKKANINDQKNSVVSPFEAVIINKKSLNFIILLLEDCHADHTKPVSNQFGTMSLERFARLNNQTDVADYLAAYTTTR